MGAWIEITIIYADYTDTIDVAPFMGAWIEIIGPAYDCAILSCRTLHGCVD